ncbi:uncharacterized protein DUF29 [Roseiarcus fermentans]|uniref:Uncharacterized protein DUF29 n=1 Tax=Roseiarcus fermentans TaxID=1473586 RepID=A0A366FT55_9HYPH|nr:DUF29 domain-containing protein [Roseiarcus fermentans]RBP17326.1 uncharacterized protein DUF29 [Roseiarcus fermentans]
MKTAYDSDFYAWAHEQAALLRSGRLAEADVEHIAEEIESLGRAEKRELVSRLTILLLHLLKWRFQPNLRGRSSSLTIKEQRKEVLNHLADNPSLRAKTGEAMAAAYDVAILKAARETAMDEEEFPAACPWTFEEATGDVWPE